VLWWRAFGLRDLFVFHGKEQEFSVNPKPFQQLDRVIHEKGRLPIMSLLAASPELSFGELKEQLSMTDGNLSVHIKTLQEAGFVSVTKSFQNRRPLTTVSLTAGGRKAFTTYIDLLEQIVRQAKEQK
jgi:DNA-binding MarR family transcriptional regulator